jgi:uncharacterized protein YfaS (alpha-2-macroglobulin family)
MEVRLLSRSNEVLAIRRTDAAGQVQFESNLTRGEGGLSPALIGRQCRRGLRLPQPEEPAFDLSDRGVAGRKAPDRRSTRSS